jgi:hypothetical protein
MLPNADITKQDFQTGGASPSSIGILAILACAATGTLNAPASYARDDLAATDYKAGPLVEYASHHLQVAKKPVVLCQTAGSVAAAYSAVTAIALGGTSVVSTDGATLPYDHFDFILTIVAGGVIGVTGITYTTTHDAGDSTSGIKALGTATSLTFANSNIKINFGVGTLVAGATYHFTTTRPKPNNADLVASLQAMKVTRQPWEGVLIDADCDTGTPGLVDTWLAGLEAVGQFKFALLNTRHKNVPVPTAESEAAYAASMTTIVQNAASIRLCVGADAADYTSTLTGISQARPVSMFLGARAMLIPVGEDPAFVGRGNLPGASIADGNGNPRWHDEDLYPDLDDQRFVTMRSFAPGGPQGTYICNANVLSADGSDYKWLQHVRTMNLACTIAWQRLSKLLSVGVGKQPPDPATGKVYIREEDAQRIEDYVNAGFSPALDKQVSGVHFKLSRTDDLSSNAQSTVTGTVKIVSLAYLKKFLVQASFSKTIAVGG